MSSTQQLAAGYISDGDLLESEAQTALEQIVSITKELFGGTEEGTAISIASGAFAVQANVSHYFIDTEAAAASDDLQYVSGTPRAGQLIAIRSVNSARIITIVNGAGGAGQILTKNGSNFVLGYGQFAIFKYVSGSPGYWEEWLRDDLARIDQMLGARPATTLTVASSAVAASRARHLIDSTTTTNLDAITTANLVDGTIIFIMTANATYVRTMRHNIAGTGKFNLIGGTSIIMAANTHYGFVKNGDIWDHIMTLNAVPAVVPVSTAAGKMLIGGASGDWVESGGTLAKGSIPVGVDANDFGYLAVGANGHIPYADSTEALGIKWAAPGGGGGIVNQFRLSLSSSDPAPVSDVTGASTIYGLPYNGNAISIYSGSLWSNLTASSISIAVPSTQYFRIYNVYVYDNASVPTFELDAWDSGGQTTKTITAATAAAPCVITTSTTHGLSVGNLIGIRKGTGTGTGWTDTAMGLDQKVFRVSAVPTTTTIQLEGCDATALTFSTYTGATLYKIPTSATTAPVRQDGIWCKTGTLTRRFLGTFMTNGAGTVDDSTSARMLSNVDNRLRAVLKSEDTTATYTSVANSTFYPRSNSFALGVTRVHFVNALRAVLPLTAVDYTTSGFTGLSLNRSPYADQTNWYSLFVGGSTQVTSTGYPIAAIIKSDLSVNAGFSFLQQQQWGNGVGYFGSSYASGPTECKITAAIER